MKIAVREWDHNGLAETRYLIDEQMRKVGWEADTVNLRYSKGTRPQKGRNIAIAEWPTDSDVGNKGYADYALFAGTKMVATIEAKAIQKDIPSVIDYQWREAAMGGCFCFIGLYLQMGIRM